MSTNLSELRESTSALITYHHGSLPAGTFAATAQLRVNEGTLREYILAGDLDDPEARIVGRIDPDPVSRTYVVFTTDRLLGGKALSYTAVSLDEAFKVLSEHLGN